MHCYIIKLEARERETRVREAPPSGCASARVPAPVAPSLSIQSRSPSVSVDLLSSPIYFRIWARVFAVGRTLAYGGLQTAGLFQEAEALIAPSSPFKFLGVEASSALRCRQSLREVEALSALRRRIVLRGVKASFTLPRRFLVVLSLEVERGVRIKMVKSKRRRWLRVSGSHGLQFVTVRHVPVMAGEKRRCSDVDFPGGGDVRGVAPRGRANLLPAMLGWMFNGLGPKRFGYLHFWAVCFEPFLMLLWYLKDLKFSLLLVHLSVYLTNKICQVKGATFLIKDGYSRECETPRGVHRFQVSLYALQQHL
ncbi:hypothetical protein F2Q69_00054782 [Brassica cretica]|uniref:Uncharacterized protein n=1 Tax=Brassica cretica TaxID=69181 RepID=A0A8S9MM14_BRACR|nr:hypothetical protein F2Q69_00054782 [Brassica cretica]